mmetsp:Transcript_41765/g.110333  ORF Transcript_41765/g.110333 Transcript_41765/m.110333 type:complete len:319 (+) Transcript_41765:367-1323(+)
MVLLAVGGCTPLQHSAVQGGERVGQPGDAGAAPAHAQPRARGLRAVPVQQPLHGAEADLGGPNPDSLQGVTGGADLLWPRDALHRRAHNVLWRQAHQDDATRRGPGRHRQGVPPLARRRPGDDGGRGGAAHICNANVGHRPVPRGRTRRGARHDGRLHGRWLQAHGRREGLHRRHAGDAGRLVVRQDLHLLLLGHLPIRGRPQLGVHGEVLQAGCQQAVRRAACLRGRLPARQERGPPAPRLAQEVLLQGGPVERPEASGARDHEGTPRHSLGPRGRQPRAAADLVLAEKRRVGLAEHVRLHRACRALMAASTPPFLI